MKVVLLGPVEATVGDCPVNLGRRQERALLAIMASWPRRFITVERLSDLLWDDAPPDHARVGVQAMVSHLRAAIRAAGEVSPQLIAGGGGYALDIDPNHVDLHLFRSRLAEANASGTAELRVRLFGEALRLWRGEPMADTLDVAQRARLLPDLPELHVAAREGLLEAQLEVGDDWSAIADLTALVSDYPLRERPVELLMRALHRHGRCSEAIEAYARLNARLSDELGLDPSENLKRLHLAVLRDDPALATGPGSVPGPLAPAQLPAAPGVFVGREEQLAALDALSTPAVSAMMITGGAGTGKTALALRWADGVRGRFPDGQLFFDLRGYSRDSPASTMDALGHMLTSLGVPPAQVPAEVAQASAMYRTIVADKRLLIMLDNALAADQVRSLLPGGSTAKVLMTSRGSLTGLVAMQDARRIALIALAPGQSVQLLRQLIGPRWSGAVDARVAADLAEACDHLPLAVRIVAARMLDEPDQPAHAHLAQLRRSRLDTLAIDGDDATAVQAAFGYSYQRLAPAARRMFRSLGLVPGPGLTAEAIAALTATSPRLVSGLLDELSDAHLTVVESNDRHAMHDLLRLYAFRQGAIEDSDADRFHSLERLVTWYIAQVSGAAAILFPGMARLDGGVAPAEFTDRDAASAWLDSERHAIVRLIVRGAEAGVNRPTALLADQLRGYLWVRRYQIDWVTAGRAALTAADACDDPLLRAAAHLGLGQARHHGAHHRAAAAHYRRSLRLYGRAGHAEGIRSAATALGVLDAATGNLPRAIRYLEHSLVIARRSGSPVEAAAPLSNLSNLYAMTGQLALAREYALSALELYRTAGARPNVAVTQGNLGAVCLHLGLFEEAREHLVAAAEATHEQGMVGIESISLTNLTALLSHTGEAEAAADIADRAVERAREAGDPLAEASAHNACGLRHRTLGQPGIAYEDHTRALETARRGPAPEVEAEALVGISRAQSALDQDGRAAAELALKIADQHGLQMLRADALDALAHAQLQQGERERAWEFARQAIEVCDAIGFGLGRRNALRTLERSAGDAGPPALPEANQSFRVAGGARL